MKKIPFWKQKTFWTGLVGAITAGASYATGQIEAYPAVMGILGSIAAIFMRQGVEKTKEEK